MPKGITMPWCSSLAYLSFDGSKTTRVNGGFRTENREVGWKGSGTTRSQASASAMRRRIADGHTFDCQLWMSGKRRLALGPAATTFLATVWLRLGSLPIFGTAATTSRRTTQTAICTRHRLGSFFQTRGGFTTSMGMCSSSAMDTCPETDPAVSPTLAGARGGAAPTPVAFSIPPMLAP